MKGIIEDAIEEYAYKKGEYPKLIEVTEREYNALNKEVKKEYESIGQECKDIEKFRGCKLEINKKIKSFRIVN